LTHAETRAPFTANLVADNGLAAAPRLFAAPKSEVKRSGEIWAMTGGC